MEANITCTFRGGRGMAYAEISHGGNKIGSHTFNQSDTWDMDLPNGVYIIMVNGVSPVNGTEVAIDHETSPSTPDSFPQGPFRRNYIMVLLPDEI